MAKNIDITVSRRQVFATLLIGIHLFIAFAFIRSASPTFDEPIHLASGYVYWKTGIYSLNTKGGDPPLTELLAAAPLLLMELKPLPSDQNKIWNFPYHYADDFLFHNTISPKKMLLAARSFSFLVWTALLLVALMSWAYRIGGSEGMIAACALYAFCPAFISNLGLATTDGGAAALFFAPFWILSSHGLLNEKRRWLLAGVCLGLAHVCKGNMVALDVFSIAAVVLDWLLANSKTGQRPPFPSRGILFFLASGWLTSILLLRITQFPALLDGIAHIWNTAREGKPSFFFGRYSTTGHPLFFPAVLAVKTPLPILIFAAAGIAIAAQDARKKTAAKTLNMRRELLWLAFPPLAYFLLAMTAKAQNGYRHILPVVPFLIIWAGYGAAWLWKSGSRPRRSLCALLMSWLALSVLHVHPHYLAYFNEAVGGAPNGYKCFVDSNLDWGQDLEALAEGIRSMGNPPIYLAYFGSADPAAYGLRYKPHGFLTTIPHVGNTANPSASGRSLLAVSATNLQGVYYHDRTQFDWLKLKKPLAIFGYSIFLYDLTGEYPSLLSKPVENRSVASK